ncbi:MAG TPA: cupin domain-containing protein [Syntrophorhabdales bacterium]|nr:cupin domain-containing protein [Syntrophorhabdales bacterium]
MKSIEVKSFDSPDEVRTFDGGKLELIELNGRTVGRATFEPGWQWSKSLGPITKTKSCEAPHFQYHLSGILHIKADDGTERDVKAGEVSALTAGHDAWVIGDLPAVVIDFQGMVDYGKGQ